MQSAVVTVVAAVFVTLAGASNWPISIGGTINTLAAIPSPASNHTEQILVSCGQCFGHSGYLAFGVVDAVQGILLSSFSKCESNSTPWYPNPAPICASRDGKFAMVTHLAGNGTQVAMTSIQNEPNCKGTFVDLPFTVAQTFAGPCIDGAMSLLGTIIAPGQYTTVVTQMNVTQGVVTTVNVPNVAGLDVYNLVVDVMNTRTFLAIGSEDNTQQIMAYLFDFDEGMIGTYELPSSTPGPGLALLVAGGMAYVILPAEPSPPLLMGISMTGNRNTLFNATLSAQGINLVVPSPLYSPHCGLVVVGVAAACYGARAAVNHSGIPEWVAPNFEGVAALSILHPMTGAIIVGVQGVGLIALNPFDGEVIWTESSPASTNFTSPAPVVLVRGGSHAITSRFDASGTVLLYSTTLKIPMPTAAPPTPAPPATTQSPANPPNDRL